MTVFSLKCLLKALGATKAVKLGLGSFELIGQLMDHADSIDKVAKLAENLTVVETIVAGWLTSATTAKVYPTEYGVAVAWDGFHLLSIGNRTDPCWYTEDQLEALEDGKDVDGYDDFRPIWKDRWNLG